MVHNEFVVNFRAVVWKEALESVRTLKYLLVLTVLLVIVMMYLPVSTILNAQGLSAQAKGVLLGSTSLYIPLMIIPVVGNTAVYRALYEERRNRTIQILLAFGVPPSDLWLGKLTVAVAISCLTSLITILGYNLAARLLTGISVIMEMKLWLIVLIVMPILAIGALALISVAYWWLRSGQAIGMLFPMVAFLGGWNLSLKYCLEYPTLQISIVSLLAGLILVAVSYIGVSFISKERISYF